MFLKLESLNSWIFFGSWFVGLLTIWRNNSLSQVVVSLLVACWFAQNRESKPDFKTKKLLIEAKSRNYHSFIHAAGFQEIHWSMDHLHWLRLVHAREAKTITNNPNLVPNVYDDLISWALSRRVKMRLWEQLPKVVWSAGISKFCAASVLWNDLLPGKQFSINAHAIDFPSEPAVFAESKRTSFQDVCLLELACVLTLGLSLSLCSGQPILFEEIGEGNC